METTKALEIFAERLLKAREDKHITQQELADKLYITRQCLSRYENAEREIKISTLLDIAGILGVSTDYLLGRTETKTTDELVQAAVDDLGITEKSVENLKAIKEQETRRKTFNIICESNEFWMIVAFLSLYFDSCKGLTPSRNESEIDEAITIISSQMEKEISELRATKYFFALVQLFEKKADEETEFIKGADENG